MTSPAEPWLEPVRWIRSSTPDWPFHATVRGKKWTLRLNDFPAEPLYTLFIDGIEITDLEDWPMVWLKPNNLDRGHHV